ncbi:helix-turn-helix domain-containing protein [Tumebacillus permanentifrigoris]|uniref:DNA-binding XRE family transcriptional regulator n=1 Tax=Tumebacillus permanentifrigoris TaxID=378543 RepID=A0A316D3I5_9BACL|nr:tetratricopeptide repeat protein [Tumebacillus permanentifrigoris]PWK05989.1 DNA-binding XRE family transcriptional regulator [Tumebacillus permanentifrigoris]
MFSLGQRVRELRLKKGLTQIELSREICTPSMISQIESDRARPSYTILYAIAEKLDVPLERLLVDVDLNLEFLSTFKMARAMVTAGEYASAIPLLEELIETPRPQIPMLEIQLDLAECYLYTEQLDIAEDSFHKVMEQGILRKDNQLMLQVLRNLGQLEFFRNRYQLAVYHWQRALDTAERLPEADPIQLATIYHHLGEAHGKLGLMHDALAYYEEASNLYQGLESLDQIGHVYMGLGMTYKRLNELKKAQDFAERALSIFEGLDNTLMTVKLQVTRASLLAHGDQTAEGVAMLEEAIAKFHELGCRDDQGIASVELAKVHLLAGELDQAEEACQAARSLLPELHVYQGWVNRVFGRIAIRRGVRDEGLRRLQKAADCFKRLGEAGEWDDTMYEVVQLHLEDQNYREAYRLLEEMRRYSRQVFESRGIVL